MAGKFSIFTGRNGETYFNLKTGSGEIILTSDGYKDKVGARNDNGSVRRNASNASRYEKKTSANGKLHFNLKAGDLQIIGSSQLYESARSCDVDIASVATNAPDATLVER